MPEEVHAPGNTGRIVIWQDGAPKEVQFRWGLRPGELGGRPWTLLRAEGRPIDRPCLIIANDFLIQTDAPAGRKRHRVSLVTPMPFFCIAGLWRSAAKDWPAAYAALTVEASPDIAPLKERHVAVVRPEDWEAWLRHSRPPEEILRPFPPGSFRIDGRRPAATGDLFSF